MVMSSAFVGLTNKFHGFILDYFDIYEQLIQQVIISIIMTALFFLMFYKLNSGLTGE